MTLAIGNVLVPTDFSDCANSALEYAIAFGLKFGSRITLLHVLQDPVAMFPEAAIAYPLPGNYLQELQESAEEGLSKIMQKIPSDVGAEAAVRHGSAFVEIVRFAKESTCDMIVIGTHGRTGLAHALLGSVAEKVVRKASCPVLTVRPTGHSFEMP